MRKSDIKPQIGIWAYNNCSPYYPIGTILYNGTIEYEIISLKPIIIKETKNCELLWYFIHNSKSLGYWHRIQDNTDIVIGNKIKTLDNIEIEIEEE